MTVTVSPEAIEALGKLSQRNGMSKSGFIEHLIRQAARREGVKIRLSPGRRGRAKA